MAPAEGAALAPMPPLLAVISLSTCLVDRLVVVTRVMVAVVATEEVVMAVATVVVMEDMEEVVTGVATEDMEAEAVTAVTVMEVTVEVVGVETATEDTVGEVTVMEDTREEAEEEEEVVEAMMMSLALSTPSPIARRSQLLLVTFRTTATLPKLPNGLVIMASSRCVLSARTLTSTLRIRRLSKLPLPWTVLR